MISKSLHKFLLLELFRFIDVNNKLEPKRTPFMAYIAYALKYDDSCMMKWMRSSGTRNGGVQTLISGQVKESRGGCGGEARGRVILGLELPPLLPRQRRKTSMMLRRYRSRSRRS